jgi:hypothetical protein
MKRVPKPSTPAAGDAIAATVEDAAAIAVDAVVVAADAAAGKVLRIASSDDLSFRSAPGLRLS